jgi:hypothetical protein
MSLQNIHDTFAGLTGPADAAKLRALLSDANPRELSDPIVRVPLSSTPAAESMLIFWRPGAISRIHDHGESCCMVRVLAGKVMEESFEPIIDGLALKTGRATMQAGDVFESASIHRVSNTGPHWAVTLHLYSPRLQMKVWAEATD